MAVRESFFIGEPARTIAKVWAELPTHQEDDIVDWSQSDVPQEEHLAVREDTHSARVVHAILTDQIDNLD